MGQIKILDRNMINMIAAGEVIERPANVVKELIENSIDATATKITVAIEDGGRKLISITDNGCGMDAEDLAQAFEPHTTSKIKNSKDLQSISTLGFRGEALASIASVAQVKAVSRTKADSAGNCIEIDCGQKVNFTPCSSDYGTTIEIRDIFYRLPARRKFLRTANTEMGHISEQFTRIAIANNNLDMTLSHNGRELYRLTAEKNLRQRIAELFSTEISENLLKVETSEPAAQGSKKNEMHIFALLGRPCISRTNNKLQYVFLNGRYIKDKFISHAIRQAYRGLIEPDRYAVVFLFIRMPHEDVDINVHPTKIEVRFYNANLVHSQVIGCLREKLLGTNLDVKGKIPIESYRGGEVKEAMAEFFKKHRVGQIQQQLSFHSTSGVKTTHRDLEQSTLQQTQPPQGQSSFQPHKKFIQIHNSFIISETEDGFVIIDQHALQERMIYEQLRQRTRDKPLESQKLLIPQTFELTGSKAELIKNNSEIIERLGIEIVPFGPRSFAVQAFPLMLSKVIVLEFVTDLIDLLDRKEPVADAGHLLDEILEMAACKAAIKAGQKLSDAEIEQLLDDSENVEMASRCPHGRPTTIKFSIRELEKQFKRT